MAEAETDEIRQAAGEVFTVLSDEEKKNPAAVAKDCLRHLHIQRLQEQINELTEFMRGAEDASAKEQALKEVMQLSKELAQLKQQGR